MSATLFTDSTWIEQLPSVVLGLRLASKEDLHRNMYLPDHAITERAARRLICFYLLPLPGEHIHHRMQPFPPFEAASC